MRAMCLIPLACSAGNGPAIGRGSLPFMGEQVDVRVLEAIASNPGSLAKRMGIVVTEASGERVVGTMPVEGNLQPFGLLHGGASCVLAETLGSVAATLHATALFGGYAVGVDISATHHRAVREGVVTGVATPLHRGGLVATYEIVITDAEGQRVCTARLTCLLRKP
jgi:1,4-dihydroxy-2-naphthoyl-CoA hydrolase